MARSQVKFFDRPILREERGREFCSAGKGLTESYLTVYANTSYRLAIN